MKDTTYRNCDGDVIFIERNGVTRDKWITYISDKNLSELQKTTTGIIFLSFKKAKESVEKLRRKKYEWEYSLE